MTEFALIGGAMIGVCVALVLVPLWRTNRATRDRRRQANIEIYRQRCAELDRDRVAGRITDAEYDTQKEELGARLLDEVSVSAEADQAENAAGRRIRRPWLASALSVLLVAAGGAAAYGWLGDWQAIGSRDTPNVDQMLDQLKGTVATHPTDRGARLMLAEVQQSQGDYQEAAHNLAIVNRLNQAPNADLLVAEAQARLSAGQDLSGRAGDLFAQALKADPDNIKALWYSGLRASEAGRNQRAVDYWQRLLEQDLPSRIKTMVRTRMNALRGDVPGL